MSARNTLGIISKTGIIKRSKKKTWKWIKFFHTICTKIQNVINEVRDVSVYYISYCKEMSMQLALTKQPWLSMC